jgi:hypothetical protein
MGNLMPNERSSLLAGRNKTPLSADDIRRAVNTFLGLDGDVNARFDPGSRTGFRLASGASGAYGEIVFGPDIYPGTSVIDPNSALSLNAAAAHELTHYYRWKDKMALAEEELEHLDEALTSLLAISRYDRKLCDSDIRQLVADAVQRIQLFLEGHRPEEDKP